MIRTNKDSPVALGIMGVILVAALFFVGKSLMGGRRQQQGARQREVSGSTQTGTSRGVAGVMPASERDPFSSPLLTDIKLVQPGQGPELGPRTGIQPSVLAPIAPVRGIRRRVALAPIKLDGVRAPSGEGPASMKAGGPLPEDENNLARSLRVTAIVLGANPYAVAEPAGAAPCTLHVGEKYHALRLVAIHASEIVLKGQSGLWTLPLATAETEAPPSGGKN